ncbi:MAG: ATP-binding protein [Betaproteobacteria bacterium AqS2]|uniref:ATP-binding protein n=1 Tax=Candidatus Amphirhobacter heronislandensis TaxID=1732024 RepID=A0A930UH98_9GAMM|nr:ATP-binding protein [Betaproteobacteria bacterium AqS2]
MIAKLRAGSQNPFKAEAGSRPLLAGREDETRRLTEMLNLLCGKREKWRGPLASGSLPPFHVIGPRGAGKTALLDWTRRRAEERGFHCVSCTGLKAEGIEFSLQKLAANAAGGMTKLDHLRAVLMVKASERLGSGKMRLTEPPFMDWVRSGLRRRPVLLLLDDAQDYDLRLLSRVLWNSHILIGRGWPLGLVMAATPGLDDHLLKDRYLADYTFYERKLRIKPLSDEATREALRAPFAQEGVTLAPGALEAMAAQTDNYPYFIQVVGGETWNEMTKAGRKDVDVKLVEQIKARARIERETIYKDAFRNLVDKELLPQGRQVIAMLEASGGEMPEKEVVKALIAANPGVNNKTAYEICDSLREDGLIWTLGSSTKPGIPSFFSYFKEQDIEEPASDST